MTKDLRSYLDFVRTRDPENIIEIERPVDAVFELSSVQKKLDSEGRFPTLIFNKIINKDIKVVTNISPSKKSLGLALGVKPAQVVERFVAAEKHKIPPKNVGSGPVKEKIQLGQQADLSSLPIVTHCEKDAGPYLTAGVAILRDPETGALNAGIYRNLFLSNRKLTLNLAPLSHASQICDKAEKAGKDLDVAIVIGHHPAMLMASQFRGNLGESELEFMGGLLDEPVDIVGCETVDIPVPADAEIVIEGKVKCGEREIDGPFADYWLYYAPGKKARVIEVTAITRRSDALYQDILNVGAEHIVLFALGMEGVVLKQLKQVIPQVVDINVPASGSGNMVYIQIKKDFEGLGMNAALAALGNYRFKCAVVVDEDVDIYDDRKIIWAIMTRTQADRSLFIVPGTYISRVDPTGYAPWQTGGEGDRVLSTRLGIDATKPLDPSFPEVGEPPKDLWKNLDLTKYFGK